MGQLPIIYVRGYAGTQGDVEETVDDPFYGFNNGSTHVRVGPQGAARFFAFESPLIRLMRDHGYSDVFEGDRQEVIAGELRNPEATVWIYRYYDVTSKTFDGYQGVRLSIEKAAEGLRQLIDKVLQECACTRVNLVAHSMGGLVCRCLLQRIYGKDAEKYVSKLFTFGTPHGGIHFDVGGGMLEWIRDKIGWNNSDDFGKGRMYQYLLPDSRTDAAGNKIDEDTFCQNDLYGYFKPDRVFCVVGTNAKDYDVAMGMSRKSVGPQSDGLVQISSAYVKNSSRAYIHRSHSGRYGMVNSEEAYQNLRRFLFGEIRVAVSLCGLDIAKDRDPGNKFYQAEVSVSLRGLPVLVHERTTANHCPIILQDGTTLLKERHHLYTFFLIPRETGETNKKTARYAVRLALYEFKKSNSWFDFSDHLEQTPLWNDYLVVDVSCDASTTPHTYSGTYCWSSVSDNPDRPFDKTADGCVCIYLPEKARSLLGAQAAIQLEKSMWD